jgi:hypothetical protein
MLLAGLMATASFINDDKVNRVPAEVSSLAVKVAKGRARMSGLERQNQQISTKLKALPRHRTRNPAPRTGYALI